MNPYFQNTRPDGYVSEHLTVGFEGERGLLIGYHASTANAGALASGHNFVGHLVRRVTTAGPVGLDHLYGHDTTGSPGGWELPDKVGNAVSLELSKEFVANDTFIVASGTGALTTATAVGTKCEAYNGKLREAQDEHDALFIVAEQVTVDSGNTGETVRIRFRKIGA